jgi:hypothetical protein
MIIGFNWGGWVTGGTAAVMAQQGRTDLAAELCVVNFAHSPGVDAHSNPPLPKRLFRILEIKAQLLANTEHSVECGIFGSPTFFVGGEIFLARVPERLKILRRVLIDPTNGNEERLAASEFDVLKIFAENPNRPLLCATNS